MKPRDLHRIIIIRNTEFYKNYKNDKYYDNYDNYNNYENYKKMQNNTKVPVKNIIFNDVADLRSSSYSIAELLLVNLHKMNSSSRFEDHLHFE